MTFRVEKVTISKDALPDSDGHKAVRETDDKLIHSPTEVILCGMISRILNEEDKDIESD